MENVRNFVDLVALGDNIAAREELDKILSQKSFDALDSRKQQIAGAIFGTTEEPELDLDNAVAELEDEEAYAEDVEHDGEQEQLDELSKATLKSYQKKAHKSEVASLDTMKKLEGKAGTKREYFRGGGYMNSPNIESLPTKQQNQYKKAKKTAYNRYVGISRSLDRTK